MSHKLCYQWFQENSMRSMLLGFGALNLCHDEEKYRCHKGLKNDSAL